MQTLKGISLAANVDPSEPKDEVAVKNCGDLFDECTVELSSKRDSIQQMWRQFMRVAVLGTFVWFASPCGTL